MPIPQQQFNNTAAKFLTLQQAEGRTDAVNNAVLLRIAEMQKKEQEMQRKNRIEAYDYALNLLSSVNSEEDMQMAKKILMSKFPDTAPGIEQMLPSYDPARVRFLRNSLRSETEKLKLEDIKGYGAGTQLFRGSEKVAEVPFSPQKPEVFQGPDGNQVYIRPGDEIPEGFTKVQAKGTQVNVNTGSNLTKGTQTEVEKNVIQGEQSIESFKDIRSRFKPEYLRYTGKGYKTLAEAMDKIGVSTKDQRTFLRERAAWYRQAKSDLLAYRKWATGVAGGEKELEEISKSFPDPDKNSPEEYQANLDNIEETTRRILRMNRDVLSKGLGTESAPPSGTIIIKYDMQGNRIQ